MDHATATASFETSLGSLVLTANDHWLLGLRITRNQGFSAGPEAVSHPILCAALSQLRDWFDGARQDFDLPLAPVTDDGARLRAAIAAIPYGETRTYGEVAAACGSVARAVGQACRTNAFPIIIPCHRVTSSTGPEYYSAGDGPRTKSWLLDFEYARLPDEKRTRLI